LNINKLKGICQEAVKHYGEESQKKQAIEECSELIQAICKDLNRKQHNAEEEIADVLIMIEQLFNIYDMKKMNYWLDYKIDRLKKRIEADM